MPNVTLDGVPQKLYRYDVDDVPVNAAVDVPPSSNWAYDHAADHDAHHVFNATQVEVFSGTTPNPQAWTDLDLSPWLGSRSALALLKVYNADGTTRAVSVRANGDINESNVINLAFGAGSADIPGTRYGFVICATSNSGVIEWKFEVAGLANVTIDLVAFIAY